MRCRVTAVGTGCAAGRVPWARARVRAGRLANSQRPSVAAACPAWGGRRTRTSRAARAGVRAESLLAPPGASRRLRPGATRRGVFVLLGLRRRRTRLVSLLRQGPTSPGKEAHGEGG